jgi:hypothetical protein
MSSDPTITVIQPSPERSDHFLSEEDLDLRNLGWDELLAVWNAWLLQASATDEMDRDQYSHGVFVNMTEPGK